MQNSGRNLEEKEKISILGCGWLGLPLATHLISKKYNISGSTTQQSKLNLLKNKGINPFLIDLSIKGNTIDHSKFFHTDILIICYPPRLKNKGILEALSEINFLFHLIGENKLKKILFVSSTSIYKNNNRINSESDADKESDFFQLEKTVQENCDKKHIKLSILRCGGLMGYGRIPCKYYAGKEKVSNGQTPVNYIFRDDVIGLIERIIELKAWDKIYNAVAPIHPSRKELLEDCFQRTAFEKCTFCENNDIENFKIISSEKVIHELKYTFKYANPLDFPY